jgi:aryl-alcohol dehydrogenase-like predicted oxidoreductase
MQYNQLGNSGLLVSRIAFGAMTFGHTDGMFKDISKVDQPLADQFISKVLDAGVNFFNSADGYTEGQSEAMLGKALGSRRKQSIIATKVGFRTGKAINDHGLSRHHILDSVENSLRRLGTDYIDVYLVHRVDQLTPLEETLRALDDIVTQGKVRYIGYSNWAAWMTSKAVEIQKQRGYTRFTAAEVYYSLVGRDLEHDVVPMAADAGIGLTIWSPLAGGFLSGKYSRENPQGTEGRLNSFDFLPYDKNKGYEIVDVLKEIAIATGSTPAQVSIAWLLAKKHVASVIIGANKMSQLEDNLGAVNVKLTPEQVQRLDEISAPARPYPQWFIDRTALDAEASKALKGDD